MEPEPTLAESALSEIKKVLVRIDDACNNDEIEKDQVWDTLLDASHALDLAKAALTDIVDDNKVTS